MKLLCVLAVALVAVSAQEYQMHPQEVVAIYPVWYISSREHPRNRRDVTFDKKLGNDARIFGTLGQNDNGLFGKGGYEHTLFNDDRGKMVGQAFGTRVLGPYGDSTSYSGAMNWKNKDATASVDYTRAVHGPSTWQAAAGGRWELGKNADVTAQGTYGKTSGMPHEYGGRADFNYRW